MSAEPRGEPTLLLIDDEPANLELLEQILELEGYTSVVRVADPRQAVAALERHAPDLILLDLHMPLRSGFEVLRDIRERTPPGEFLPVLVLTADVTSQARERALREGAQDFLTKPFDAVEVALRVRNLLTTRVLQQREREARLRAALLAEASRALATSLDCGTTLAGVARLLVPALADGCALLLRGADGYEPVETAHRTAAGEAQLREALARPDGAARAAAALQGERAAPVEPLPGGAAVGVGGPGSVLAVPIRLHGRPLGGLLLLRAGEARGYPEPEVELAEEIAARAAVAVENARLFAEAQLATRTRDRMLSVVAHDLRNPLAVVTMYAEMLLSMLPPEDEGYQREALESIFQSTFRMQNLIEDLLDVSRLQQGALALAPVCQPVEPLLAEAERTLRALPGTRPVELRFERSGAFPAQVRADGGRLLQVLSNLVGNALKFTPDGGHVRIRWAAEDGQLRVTVADTGPGIPADLLPHVFGAFWQASRADHRGVGLGLWISQAIVAGHGGRIWVDSREGEGASFHFTLPWSGPVSAEADAPPPPGHPTHAVALPTP